MARIESQAKAGFYPTPDTVSEMLKKIIKFEEGSRLLDPCCGKGKTLSRLADSGPDLTTYGIELDHQRANEARSRLTRVLWGDSLTEVQVTPSSFGLLYLNPPYDTNVRENGKAQRMEVLFLRRYLGTLQKNGCLVLVIPYYILKHCAKALARYFKVVVLGFPEEEFQAFKQCLVFGVKKHLVHKNDAQQTMEYLANLARLEPDVFLESVAPLEVIEPESFTVPAAVVPLTTFRARNIDPLETLPEIKKAGTLAGLLRELTPQKKDFIRPVTTVDNGHLALMLAGGYINGCIKNGDRQLVIKGMVSKSEEEVSVHEKQKGCVVVTRDRYTPTVKAIDLDTAELLLIQ